MPSPTIQTNSTDRCLHQPQRPTAQTYAFTNHRDLQYRHMPSQTTDLQHRQMPSPTIETNSTSQTTDLDKCLHQPRRPTAQTNAFTNHRDLQHRQMPSPTTETYSTDKCLHQPQRPTVQTNAFVNHKRPTAQTDAFTNHRDQQHRHMPSPTTETYSTDRCLHQP